MIEPRRFCGKQPLKSLKSYDLLQAGHFASNLLKAVFHKFYLVHSWILFPKWQKQSLHGCSTKRLFLKILKSPQENICAGVYMQALRPAILKKDTSAQIYPINFALKAISLQIAFWTELLLICLPKSCF